MSLYLISHPSQQSSPDQLVSESEPSKTQQRLHAPCTVNLGVLSLSQSCPMIQLGSADGETAVQMHARCMYVLTSPELTIIARHCPGAHNEAKDSASKLGLAD